LVTRAPVDGSGITVQNDRVENLLAEARDARRPVMSTGLITWTAAGDDKGKIGPRGSKRGDGDLEDGKRGRRERRKVRVGGEGGKKKKTGRP
jgi:hypothetical protein